MIIRIIAYFAGVSGIIWIASLILTFIWKKCTKKKVTHRIIIISTIIAGIIRFLISSAFTIDLMEVILVVISIPLVILVRFSEEEERKRQNN